MEVGFLIIPVFIIIAIMIRLAAGGMDRDRIRQYVEERGGQVLESNWSPFGPGWFGEKSDRIYGVRYRDKDGNVHEAHCKTSLFSGVYLTADRIVKRAPSRPERDQTPTESALAAENRRLREELERVRRQQGQADQGGVPDRWDFPHEGA